MYFWASCLVPRGASPTGFGRRSIPASCVMRPACGESPTSLCPLPRRVHQPASVARLAGRAPRLPNSRPYLRREALAREMARLRPRCCGDNRPLMRGLRHASLHALPRPSTAGKNPLARVQWGGYLAGCVRRNEQDRPRLARGTYPSCVRRELRGSHILPEAAVGRHDQHEGGPRASRRSLSTRSGAACWSR